MILEDFLQRFGASLPHASGAAVLVAIVAGVLASAVCPCTLPVGIGLATAAGGTESEERRSGLLVALAFFLGIVVNLTLLGAVAGRLGAILTESFGRYWALGMAVFSLTAAMVAFWGPRLKVQRLADLRRPGISGAFVYGFIFSLGTCCSRTCPGSYLTRMRFWPTFDVTPRTPGIAAQGCYDQDRIRGSRRPRKYLTLKSP